MTAPTVEPARDRASVPAAEGDLHHGPLRREWQRDHLSADARRLLDADADLFLHQALSTPCLNALAEAVGPFLIDVDGRPFYDLHGNSAHQVGHRHPRVVEAVKRQLDTLAFSPRRYANAPASDLAARLIDLAPGDLRKVLFAPGGTSAIGIALKLARYATGRHKTLAFRDSFHGASLDALAIGDQHHFREGLGPLMPGAFHIPCPRADDSLDASIAAVRAVFDREGDIGAFIAEPLRCTTLHEPPEGYWPAVRELCDLHGVLLVFDEIPLALGYTGAMFCCEHFDATPDVLVIGKGLGGAVMPMAAILARGDLDRFADRSIGHYTHEKSPLGSAAALAVLDVIESDNLLARADAIGRRLAGRIGSARASLPMIAAVRRRGALVAVDLAGEEPAERALYAALSRGVSFKVSAGRTLTLTPPLILTDDQADDIADRLVAALHDAQPHPTL